LKSQKKILLFHGGGYGSIALGDRIRIQAILEYLSKNGFNVIEARIHSRLQKIIMGLPISVHAVNRFKSIPSLSLSRPMLWLDVNAHANYFERVIRRTSPDVVIAETSIIGWIASSICRIYSVPCLVDIHGLLFAEQRGQGLPHWEYYRRLEKEVFQSSDHIFVVSKYMKNYISRSFNISPGKITVVPNGGNPQPFSATYKVPLRIIYAGNFAYWEKVDDFLDLAKYLAHDYRFRFYLVGAGSLKNKLLSRVESEKIPVKYLGYIPRRYFFSVLSRMQVGVAPSTRDLARVVASPIKVFDYMSVGLPVVTPSVGDWGEIVKKEDAGIVLENDSIENYAKALDILANEEIWTRKSLNAKNILVGKYNWENVLKPLIDVVNRYI
jgi:glycosyltransferase involved in cell wall biosynthesis